VTEKIELPPDWDWVTARHACSPEKFFERLSQLARRDTEKRNALLATWSPLEFVSAEPKLFSVTRRLPTGEMAGVRFGLKYDGTIWVEGVGHPVQGLMFEGNIALTDQGICKLSVGSDWLTEAQVLRRALQDIFFRQVD
jgi:hypothetical protein